MISRLKAPSIYINSLETQKFPVDPRRGVDKATPDVFPEMLPVRKVIRKTANPKVGETVTAKLQTQIKPLLIF
jgi:hypothetical protein